MEWQLQLYLQKKKKNSQIAQEFFPTSVVSLITSNTKPQIKQFGEYS